MGRRKKGNTRRSGKEEEGGRRRSKRRSRGKNRRKGENGSWVTKQKEGRAPGQFRKEAFRWSLQIHT